MFLSRISNFGLIERRTFRNCQAYMSSNINHAENLLSLLGFRVGSVQVHTEDNDLSPYLIDWTKSFGNTSYGSIVCFPRDTTEVSNIVKYCHSHSVGVVPQGGNTGLCGGSVAKIGNEIILSFKNMTKIINIDEVSSTITCEAGCILENLNAKVQEKGLMVPLDLGAKGSCMIGGNVSTNAGGLRVIRYGSMFQNVLGLEVVLADGKILNLLRPLRKDNTGYHLKNLFIGSEGTLGIITKVCMQLVPHPQSSKVLLFKIGSFESLLPLLSLCRKNLGDILSAFEFIDTSSFHCLQLFSPHLLNRFPDHMMPNSIHAVEQKSTSSTGQAGIAGEVLVLVEVSGGIGSVEEQRLENFLSILMDQNLIIDGIWSSDLRQEEEFWKLREHVPVALMGLSRRSMEATAPTIATTTTTAATTAIAAAAAAVPVASFPGKLLKYDVSLSLLSTNNLVEQLRQRLLHQGYFVDQYYPLSKEYQQVWIQICCFGHAGDENLHLNLLVYPLSRHPTYSSDIHHQHSNNSSNILQDMFSTEDIHRFQEIINHEVFELVHQLQGSISAEHGIGQSKVDVLHHLWSSEEKALSHQLKHMMDPNNILNPGKVVHICSSS